MPTFRAPVYYGWLVLAASAVSEMLVMGATSYSSGLFVLPLQAEFHLSRADASSAVLLLYAGAIVFSPIIGRSLDRHSVRTIMAVAALVFALSFAVISFSHSLLLMSLVLLLPAAASYVALGPLTTATLASRWFYKRRGLALGIAAISTSGGGLVVVPLLTMAITAYGWRLGLFFESIAIGAIILLLAVCVVRDHPFKLGLEADPENHGRAAEPKEVNGLAPALGWRDVTTRWVFWVPSLTLAMIAGIAQAIITALAPYGVQLGLSPARVATLISAFAVAAAITKVTAGLLADRFDRRLMLVGATLAMTLSAAVLSGFAAYVPFLLASIFAGIALGCALPTAGALMAEEFGAAQFGTAMGWTYTLIFLLAIAAGRFIGASYDYQGTYTFGFGVFAGLMIIPTVMTILFAARRGAR